MSISGEYSEDLLIEQPAIELFGKLGWKTANCFDEFAAGGTALGRETAEEVILLSRLQPALERLNPTLPAEAINLAVEELAYDRSKMSMAAANREIYRLLKNGIKVSIKTDTGDYAVETVLEAEELDEEQEKKFGREFGREYHLITREDRLETIAEDLVNHYMGRDFSAALGPGKAMVVSIDKATAVKMYDKAQKYWRAYLGDLQLKLKTADEFEEETIEKKIRYMQETDMAVVVSQSQNEVEEMKKKGVDIIPHRKRMVKEDLDKKFKDPEDPFGIVFVCAMWMTGFDVPCCTTIYLDKPMRNHTLMQTIARANRVFPDKVNGLIVDYVVVIFKKRGHICTATR